MFSIGITKASARELFRHHGLTPFRNLAPPELFRSLSPKRLLRANRVLIPEVVFWLMSAAVLSDVAMVGAILQFWASLRALWSHLPAEPLTEEAFCVARKALPLSFFRELFRRVCIQYQERFPERYLWRGLRLRAIDGSLVELPRCAELLARFPVAHNRRGTPRRPQARLVALVDLWAGLSLEYLLVSLKQSEQRAAAVLLRFLRATDLLLADRNFATLDFLALLLERQLPFLIRVQANRYHRVARRATGSGVPGDCYVRLPLPKRLQKRYPSLPATVELRMLEVCVPGFRPVRLISSLCDPLQYPAQELMTLYCERWRHETFYREYKYTLEINNLRSHSKQGILKEIYVQLTLNNLLRSLQSQAVDPPLRPVDLSFRAAKRLVLAALPVMEVAPVAELPLLYKELLRAIATKRILVRPGRHYPRPGKKLKRGPVSKGNCSCDSVSLPEVEHVQMPNF